MKTASEYRSEARAKLTGNLGMSILVFFVSSIILGAASSFFVGILILWGPIMVGVSTAFIGLFRRDKIEFNDLFRTFDSNFGNHLIMGLLYNIFVFLWSLLFVIPGIVASYSYSMAPYILADNPEMDGKAALDASKKLMRGKKGKLFCLHLSFIGWLILSLLTFGILYICYVGPYMQAAQTAFYESIKYEVPETYAKLTSETTAEGV
ncbi:MAG: DUF975 family protein [Clostridiales bacterium]|nr:DUF975 family protein [Clostridiales bacterium]